MKALKFFLEIIGSFFVSYIIFYHITSDFISYFFQGSFRFEQILYIIIYFGQSIVIYYFINFLQKNKISKNQIKLLWILYACVMLILLFGRMDLGSMINLNIMELFNFDFMNISQIVLNFILFMPIGYWIKNFKMKKAFILTIIFVFSIEILQLVTHRGIFDIVDIIIDSLSIMCGYFICKKYNFKIIK